ncbi:MAG: thiamine pyrophosphate-binding protein, partial [Rhodospirillaceae bacterium]|nr:thiamine pyrophosphate-binding protein [Rhodospirillaceae bacterium]
GIPFCTQYWNALDVITSDFAYYGGRVGTYGGPGRNFGIQNSDLLLSIGSRVSGRITGGNIKTFARGARKYIVDVDKALLQPKLQQVPFDVNMLCDAKLFCEHLLARAAKRTRPLSNTQAWMHRVIAWREKYDPVKPEFMGPRGYVYEGKAYTHPYAFIRRLSEKLAADAVIVCDIGGLSAVISHALKTRHGQRCLANYGNAPMGFAFAGAIGAAMAEPRRQIICLIGDGGMNMNIQELQTVVNYGLNIKTFILNNHIYGITKAFQETNFQGRKEACGPIGYNPPDFLAIARAYNIETTKIADNAGMDAGIDETLRANGAVICDVNMHEYHTYEPRIFGWATPIEDMYPYLPREEFRANMSIEPHETWTNPKYPDILSQDGSME